MRVYAFLMALVLPFCINAQSNETDDKKDPVAVMILDQMAEIIGDLESCSFTLHTSNDYIDQDFGLLKNHSIEKVYFDGPQKLMVDIDGTRGKQGFWYNGSTLEYYSYDNNTFVSIETPDTTIAMIDSINVNYGIKFPAADFFFPNLTDDVMENFETLDYVGTRDVEGVECFLIKATNDKMEAMVWITNNAYHLPKRHVVVYKDEMNRQFETTFSDWSLNPNIPDALFEFRAPSDATAISILPVK